MGHINYMANIIWHESTLVLTIIQTYLVLVKFKSQVELQLNQINSCYSLYGCLELHFRLRIVSFQTLSFFALHFQALFALRVSSGQVIPGPSSI